MKKILILHAGLSQSLSFAKFIRRYSDFYIVGFSPDRYSDLKYYHEIVLDYSKINFEDYDFILPTGTAFTSHILAQRSILYFENNIIFKKENLLAFDKSKMLDICRCLNISIPNTYESIDDITDFPIFYKKKYENSSVNIRGVAKNLKEIPDGSDLIYQEYISNKPVFGVGFLAKNGKLITSFTHKEVLSTPESGGSAVVIEAYFDDCLLQKVEKLVDFLNYDGWGLAEFKYCNIRSDYVFMEVNSKFWASVEFALQNNPEFLLYLFNISYQPKKINRMLYINRMFSNGLLFTLKHFLFLFNSKIIIENYFFKDLLKMFIPAFLKRIIREYFYA